jgi:hypothetical protein
MSKCKISKPPIPLKPLDEKLASWLVEQAAKLKTMGVTGNRLKLDYVRNARDKGKLLHAVKERLAGTSQRFDVWVSESTDIGYSTALLYLDVAGNFDLVKEQFADSNALELTLGEVRDAIRDARQGRGMGKPGSGNRKVTNSGKQPISRHSDDEADNASDHEDASNAVEDDAPNRALWEGIVARAQADEAAIEGPNKGTQQTQTVPLSCTVTAMVFDENDEQAMQQVLLNCSPISKASPGSKQHRTVSATVQPTHIVSVMTKLGKVLEAKQNAPEAKQHKKLRVSIEL